MLSIVVLTCNQRDHTLRLLDSLRPILLTWRDEDETEVVIVDNGSSDSTLADIERFRLNADISPDKLRVVALPTNRGVAAGRNVGLDTTRGDIILLLDNDTIINIEAITGMLNHLRSNPNCGICAPALVSPDGELQASAKPYPGLGIKLAHILCKGYELCKGHELRCERDELKKQHPFYVIGAFQMFRRKTLEKVGKLDDRIFYGPEDADFCTRVRDAGFTIDYIPELQIIHDWRRATRKKPWSRLALLHARGLLHFWIKHRRFF